MVSAAAIPPVLVGRYAIFDRIASGGMAAVHVARLAGEGGFARTVAVKRLHPQFALDPEFVAMFLDEARVAGRIRHRNVVPTLDIVAAGDELFLVMEYVEGESLGALLRSSRARGGCVPVDVAAGVMIQALHGLHAAHEATNDLGEPLHLVHRDVSPQNILVGVDGVGRVLDFGVAKAFGKLHTTREGQLKGKLGYLAPEQIFGHPVTRRTDVFAAAVVFWETITGLRLFAADSEGDVLRRIMDGVVERPSRTRGDVPATLDAVVMRALSREPSDRFDTALAMAQAIEQCGPPASHSAIGAWMHDLARDELEQRAQLLACIESGAPPPPSSRTPVTLDIASRTTIDDPDKKTHADISFSKRRADVVKKRAVWATIAIGAAVCAGAALAGVAVRETRPSVAISPAPPSLSSPIQPSTDISHATDQAPPHPATTSGETPTIAPTRGVPRPPSPRVPASVQTARSRATPSPSPSAAPSPASLYSRE